MTQGPSLFEGGVETAVGLGATIRVFRLAGSSSGDAVTIGAQVGVSARFVLQLQERDLIATDWVFTAPLVWHRGRHWFRIAYRHWSAHLGDEYIERFEVERLDFARDTGEGLAYLQLFSWLGVYGGGGYAFNVDPSDGRRFGFQLGAQADGPRVLPEVDLYAAVDLQVKRAVALEVAHVHLDLFGRLLGMVPGFAAAVDGLVEVTLRGLVAGARLVLLQRRGRWSPTNDPAPATVPNPFRCLPVGQCMS